MIFTRILKRFLINSILQKYFSGFRFGNLLPPLTKSCKKWIWFGLFIRLLLIPYSGHPDLFFIFGTPFHFLNDQVFDIYQHLAEYFSAPSAALYSYQPLHYFFFGLWSGFTQIFVDPEYSVWMRQVIDQFPSILRDSEAAFSFKGAGVRLEVMFLWKSLYLICDLLILFFILKIIPGDKEKESYISWWAGSIVILYSQYLFGQCGIVPMTIIFLGAYLYKVKGDAKWMGLCFALSVPFKLFPIMLLPLPILLAKGWKGKVTTSCYILFPLLIIYLPFIIHSSGMVFMRITGGLGASYTEGIVWDWVLIVSKIFQVLGYAAVFYHAGFRHQGKFEEVLRYLFICFLLLLCVPLKIHYYAWITPLWFLFFHEKRGYVGIYATIVLLLFFANLSDKQTFIGLFAPLAPDFFMSFPGWMDISYFIFPSGFHAKIAILIIFILTIVVVVDQLSTLFNLDLEKLAFKKEETPPVRSSRALILYPLVWVLFMASLLAFAHPDFKTKFKNYFFTRSSNFYYEPQLKQMQLPPGQSLDQTIALQKGWVKQIGLYFDEPIEQAATIEIFELREGRMKKVYEKKHKIFNKGWVDSSPDSFLAESKTVIFRLTNISPSPLPVSIRKLPNFAHDFKLTMGEKNGDVIAGGVLRINVLEEPLFLHSSDFPLRSILNSLNRERNFLIFWLVLLLMGVFKIRQHMR